MWIPHCLILGLLACLGLMPASCFAAPAPCRMVVDQRLKQPVQAIVDEFTRRVGTSPVLEWVALSELQDRIGQADVVVALTGKGETNAVVAMDHAQPVAWKYPTGEPVWAAVCGKHPAAWPLALFLGGATGHRLWAESPMGYTITSGVNHAEAFAWVADHRVAHTYPITARRMLRECGGVREGLCIDIGCGTGRLDVELARLSDLEIIGLDIDPDMKSIFEQTVQEAGFQDRVSFVEGDAQKLPFPDNHVDLVVSRGTLVFIPDIAQCLREVARVLKPTGVAFLGGRYLYTPQKHKLSNEALEKIVESSGVPGARLVVERGQWVKIVGPDVPQEQVRAATGPHLLAERFLAEYAITEGEGLLLGTNLERAQALRPGFEETTDLNLSTHPATSKTVQNLPYKSDRFDVIAGVGPILLWDQREEGMKEIHRLLKPGGVALIGGQFRHMPASRKVSSEALRESARHTGIHSIQVMEDRGQWIEIRKGIVDRGVRD